MRRLLCLCLDHKWKAVLKLVPLSSVDINTFNADCKLKCIRCGEEKHVLIEIEFVEHEEEKMEGLEE